MKWKAALIGSSIGLCLGGLAVVMLLSGAKGDIFAERRLGVGIFTVYEQRVETTTNSRGQKIQESEVNPGPGMVTLPAVGGMAGLVLGALVGLVVKSKNPQRTA